MLQNVTVGKNPVVHAADAGPPYRRRRACALQPQQPRYIGEFAETVETSDIRLVPPISATTL
jgi:hypothetical protein